MIGIDTGLFTKWAEAKEPVQSTSQLAELAGVQPAMMGMLQYHSTDLGQSS